MTLCKFQMYHIVIQYVYTLQSDHHCKCPYHHYHIVQYHHHHHLGAGSYAIPLASESLELEPQALVLVFLGDSQKSMKVHCTMFLDT